MSDTKTINTGKVAQVMGPVVDVRFEDTEGGASLPAIHNALTMPIETEAGKRTLTVEVAQHIGDNTVRCIAMASTDGLRRGTRRHRHRQRHQRAGGQGDPRADLQRSRRRSGRRAGGKDRKALGYPPSRSRLRGAFHLYRDF